MEEEGGAAEGDGEEGDGAEEEVVSAAPFADPISAESGQSCRLLVRAWRMGDPRLKSQTLKVAGSSGHHLPVVKKYCGVVRPADGTRR